jgi:hypothetical protein
MRFATSYGLTLGQGGFPVHELPLTVDVDGAHVELTVDAAADQRLNILVEVPVDPSTLRLERKTGTRASQDSTEELPAIDFPEAAIAGFTLKAYARDARDTGAVVEDVLARASGAGVGS